MHSAVTVIARYHASVTEIVTDSTVVSTLIRQQLHTDSAEKFAKTDSFLHCHSIVSCHLLLVLLEPAHSSSYWFYYIYEKFQTYHNGKT